MYIPVLTSISFIDPRDRYQEHQYSIDNRAEADRIVHVDDVHHADGSGPPLKVERIDTWKIIDPRNRYQESHVEFDNVTGADQSPPHFSQHQKTHVYRYYKDPENPSDSGTWIDTELIDELATVDPRDRHQEVIHTLDNPVNGDLSGQASPDDPDITNGDGAEGIAGNPLRTDPFQNIIAYHEADLIGAYQYFVFRRWLVPSEGPPPGGDFYPVDNDWAEASIASGEGVYQMSFARTTLSRAVHDAMTLGPNDYGQADIFVTWDTINGRTLYQFSYDQPARNARPTFDYYFIAISYSDDDMNTGDWPPPFEPL